MRIKITADSTCDLSKELTEKYDISIIPLYISKNGETFKDGVDITADDIFEYVDSGAGTCGTVAINISDYTEFFAQKLADYDALIHINISSDFSSCHQNAKIAASEFENVYVIDSRNLSTGMGHIALDAAILAEGGMAPEAIVAELARRTEKVDTSFIINTLTYLHKGGRCSGVALLGANLLSLKPCIEVVDGKMQVGKKYRGNLKNVMRQYVTDRLSGRDDIEHRRIFITHTSVYPEEICQMVRSLVAELGPFEEIIETVAGCTISNHCGTNCLGILFYKK